MCLGRIRRRQSSVSAVHAVRAGAATHASTALVFTAPDTLVSYFQEGDSQEEETEVFTSLGPPVLLRSEDQHLVSPYAGFQVTWPLARLLAIIFFSSPRTGVDRDSVE